MKIVDSIQDRGINQVSSLFEFSLESLRYWYQCLCFSTFFLYISFCLRKFLTEAEVMLIGSGLYNWR